MPVISSDCLFPILSYERIKFGAEFANISAIDGFANTEAGIMIVHSADDATVPTRFGYDKFYEKYKDNDRFRFILYEDRGHTYLLYSESALKYNEDLNAKYDDYIKECAMKDSDEIKAQFMSAHLDKKQCFDINYPLMEEILIMFDEYCS